MEESKFGLDGGNKVESYRWVIRHRGLALKERVERPLKKSLSLGLLGVNLGTTSI
jgi:hypothetical protein